MQNSRPPNLNAYGFAPRPDSRKVWRDMNGDAQDKSRRGNAVFRRPQMACDVCRRRKIKCQFEGSVPVCLQCLARGTKCVVNWRRPKTESLKRAQHVRSLETRLKQIESLLRTAGVLSQECIDEESSHEDDEQIPDYENETEEDDEYDLANNDEQPPDRTSVENITSSSSTSPHSSDNRDGDSQVSHVSLLKTDAQEDQHYFGSSSSLNILSHNGIQWVREMSGETDFPNTLLSQSCWSTPSGYWRSDVFHDLFSCRVYKALPPRSEVFSLLNTYFQTTNSIFPLYHEESFMRLVEWQYTQQTCTNVAWWASINILLALSYRYRPTHSPRPEKDTERAWLYFKNAASAMTELTLRRNDLLGIQTLLAMALFLRGNSSLKMTVPVVTAAIRSSHCLGLHKRYYRLDLSPMELEHRKRIFWIAYIFDQSIAIHTGLGSMHIDEDFDVELPDYDPLEAALPTSSPRHWCVRYFRILCQHTVIRSRIYKELYSMKALAKSLSEVRATVDKLNTELERWKQENPYLSSSCQPVPGKEDEIELIAKLGQRLSYYNSLIMINRMPLMHEVVIWIRARPSVDPLQSVSSQSKESSLVCVRAAQDTLKLINLLPWRDIGYAWSLLDYLFVAVVIVFTSIVREPKHSKVKEELDLLNTAVMYFTTLAPQNGRSKTAKFMAKMGSILERTAKKVVEKAAKESRASEAGATGSRTGKSSSTASVSNIEGLPPVNSLGYFVPESPQNSFIPLATMPTTSMDTAADLTSLGVSQDMQAPGYPWMLPDTYSSLANDSSIPPELWQIPITAEWQMLDQMPNMSNLTMPEQNLNANIGEDLLQRSMKLTFEGQQWMNMPGNV